VTTILVCGSRHWTDRATIRAWLSKFPNDTTVVHGACRGADTIAGDVARVLGFAVRKYPAEWKRHGAAAGPIRNQRMIDEEHPVRAFAFTDALMRDRRPTGTLDCVSRLLAAGVPVTIVPPTKSGGGK